MKNKRCPVMFKNLRGFTLIELLVVISIIALLLSIMMPGLQRARQQGQAIACRSNLRQMGLGMSMYATDNQDKFPSMEWTAGNAWFHKIAPFLGDLGHETAKGEYLKFMHCASTRTNPLPNSRMSPSQINNHMSPRIGESIGARNMWNIQGTQGAYGVNQWLGEFAQYEHFDPDGIYRKWSELRGQVPLFSDAMWYGAWPNGDQEVPTWSETEEPVLYNTLPQMMKRFAINRHNRSINVAFSDLSVEGVRLESLWGLSWKKQPVLNRDVQFNP